MTSDRSVVFSGPPVFSTNQTDRHDIIEMLLKVALNAIIHNATVNEADISNRLTKYNSLFINSPGSIIAASIFPTVIFVSAIKFWILLVFRDWTFPASIWIPMTGDDIDVMSNTFIKIFSLTNCRLDWFSRLSLWDRVSTTSSSLSKIEKWNKKNNSQRMFAVCIWTFYNFTVVWIQNY